MTASQPPSEEATALVDGGALCERPCCQPRINGDWCFMCGKQWVPKSKAQDCIDHPERIVWHEVICLRTDFCREQSDLMTGQRKPKRKMMEDAP